MNTFDQREFRNAMGNFCSGVVVVTSTDKGEPVGFTAQSFVSLSLDPPLVSVCPGKRSGSWQRIKKSGRYCINILADCQQGLSNHFATPIVDKFAGIHWYESKFGSPILKGSLAYIDCEIEAEHDAGDHLIAVGRVVDFASIEQEKTPLLYFRSQYFSLCAV